MGRHRIRYLILLIIILLSNNLFAASSKYSSYGLPGEAMGMRFKVFAYNGEKAAQVLAKAQDTYQKLLQDLGQGGLMFKQCLIFFWENREDFVMESKKLSKDSDPEQALAFADYQFSRREVAIFAYESPGMFANTLPHEITHQILAQGLCFTGIPYIPLWLNEGLAQHMEEDKKARHLLISSAVKKNEFFALKVLTYTYSYPQDNVRRALFYAQSLSLVEFFLENYSGDMLWSLARRLVHEKKPMEKALRASYWPDIETIEVLEKKWLDWIKEKDYFQKASGANPDEASTDDYLPLTSSQEDMIEEMKKKVKKVSSGDIWRSQHFSVRMEGLSRKELGVKKAGDLENIYGAVLFILEEAYDKIGDEMDYHPGGKIEVYLYAPAQYSIYAQDAGYLSKTVELYADDIAVRITEFDRIRKDLVAFLYRHYAYSAIRNKGGPRKELELIMPEIIEWGKKGKKNSKWKKGEM